MPLIVPETGSGADPLANSYVSLSAADSYFQDRGITEWGVEVTAIREGSLLYAARWLDHAYNWQASIKDFDQPMAWPRFGVLDQERRLIENNEIPTPIKDAQCELAFEHLKVAALNRVDDLGGPVESVRVGTLAVAFREFQPGDRTRAYVDLLVRGYTEYPSGSAVAILRG